MSKIAPATLAAYRETDYCVFREPPFALQIGIASEPLAKLYQQFASDCAAFVTACNPHSQMLDHASNTTRMQELEHVLDTRGLNYFPGAGKHPDGNWPAEASLLVLAIALEEAKALGQQFEQNAIVWCGADAVPELVILR